jgi:multiple sugar transport system ATP-binding protein
MTAREILEFPLRMRGVAKAERARAVEDAASLLHIERLLDRRPSELSGGERQRVAMGRAIVRRPRLFLFDEPLSNLDAGLRAELRVEIGALVRRLDATSIYVTHDHVEAMTLADRIAVMKDGRVLQVAAPREVYERPADSFVATFIGTPRMNLLSGDVEDGTIVAGPLRVPCPRGELPRRVDVGFRPADVRLAGAGTAKATGMVRVRAEVVGVEPLGAETHLFVRLDDGLDLRAVAPGFLSHRRGEIVELCLDVGKMHVFDPSRDGTRVHIDATA